jgi:ubiquinone/menaquinone biosynthesis C-methylase UbiE
MRFAAGCGALEVHLIEPSATGKLAGNTDALLTEEERARILHFQHEMADRDDMPILSSFQYLESPQAFGCGAGLTHLYIDGAGEVCPCNLVPLSFGNVASETLAGILEKMGGYFCKPRTECVGRTLSPHICGDSMPLDSEASVRICRECLPKRHKVPRFFRVKKKAREEVGNGELKIAYNRIHGSYDHFWLSEAGKPIDELVDRVKFKNGQHVCEVGCGTGYGTALIADRLGASGDICAVDLSDGMLSEARGRAVSMNIKNARFINQDALKFLNTAGSYDVIFSSWVLGYIPLAPFLRSARHALAHDGRIAFVVHKENSPREQLEIFWEIIAEDPSVLKKRVAFDFPRNIEHTQQELVAAGFEAEQIWEGKICFQHLNPKEVLEHLLKSGAGTAFYDAVDRCRRKALKQRFIDVLSTRRQNKESYFVVHDYISCIAKKTEIV